jgi:deoxyribonuclease-1
VDFLNAREDNLRLIRKNSMFKIFLIVIFFAYSSSAETENISNKNITPCTKAASSTASHEIKANKPLYPITSFKIAKKKAHNEIYYDNQKTFYCRCSFNTTTTNGAILNTKECGYKPKRVNNRSKHMEWEHIVPAYEIYKNLSCYKEGHPECLTKSGVLKGRKCCAKVDKWFQHAEADLHNLVPAIGELNADRSNFRFKEIDGEKREYGACDFEIKDKIAEPTKSVRGDIARIWLYMIDVYKLDIEVEYIKLLRTWSILDPVSDWEITRDERIKKIQGNSNHYLYQTSECHL